MYIKKNIIKRPASLTWDNSTELTLMHPVCDEYKSIKINEITLNTKFWSSGAAVAIFRGVQIRCDIRCDRPGG